MLIDIFLMPYSLKSCWFLVNLAISLIFQQKSFYGKLLFQSENNILCFKLFNLY